MEKEVIIFTPYLEEKIWGGKKIANTYSYHSKKTIGECWGFSTIRGKESVVSNGTYRGLTLQELYSNQPELFGYPKYKEFPLLIKIIDASRDLSIQVHPDENFVRNNQYKPKNEAWFILDTIENNNIIFNHTAPNKKAFLEMFNNKQYDKLFEKKPINKNDYVFIPAGTVHAILKGTLIYEVQQTSDTTFRLYDYDRLDNGIKRELHIQEGLDAICFDKKTKSNKYFEQCWTKIFDVKSFVAHIHGDYLFIKDGAGKINNTPVRKGMFIMIPSKESYIVNGNIELLITTLK